MFGRPSEMFEPEQCRAGHFERRKRTKNETFHNMFVILLKLTDANKVIRCNRDARAHKQ